MLDYGNPSNNMMAEYNSAQNAKSSPSVSPESAAKSNTVKTHGSSGGVISEYSSGQNPKTGTATSGNGAVSEYSGKNPMTNQTVSPSASGNKAMLSAPSDAQNKMNAAVSPVQTESKGGVKSNYMGGQGCLPNRTSFPAETPVAMAYVPFQHFDTTYPAERGLVYGTIFPELNKPFLGGGMAK
ncbi:Spore coat associated protein JA (CotJA) [Caprobacter fermentans]|uniref:Spore coat associated protein JA (CotJA) n=2 Tax=Caproicibacter fermentans TaxID=2576756 RepID=A0A6N8HUY3_9FIRM|nr:spore coat associated protein CotJA [Caproicibacter fermentans]MVB09586.1 Spore coat associated protein JA (CotJA) [Caproicibacter fermentans]